MTKLFSFAAADSSFSKLRLVVHQLCWRDWGIRLRQIKKEHNAVADHMAKLALPEYSTLTIFDTPLTLVLTLLVEDISKYCDELSSKQAYTSQRLVCGYPPNNVIFKIQTLFSH
ncbi:hypothetical protein J1N35_000343 [Gossypium stocksii]|uniref:RNase H type-1 domain-containing protein n=1 Tax=Gossypium stocksii TaxID=47602 RepID=A0A9D3WH19_9ROSI|nr:hypothetical protein J1N35_000343 [Gossypium stocksii]